MMIQRRGQKPREEAVQNVMKANRSLKMELKHSVNQLANTIAHQRKTTINQ